jgi:RNA polymerase sigma-70 factor, ECF subfamily
MKNIKTLDLITGFYSNSLHVIRAAIKPYVNGDTHLAEDLTQETFLNAIRYSNSYSPRRPFTTWMYTIALNVARRHVMKSNEKHVLLSDLASEEVLGFTSATYQIRSQEDFVHLIECITNLPPDQREFAQVLMEKEGTPLSKIAEENGLSRRQIYGRKRKLREDLSKKLSE